MKEMLEPKGSRRADRERGMVALALLIALAAGTGFMARWLNRGASTNHPTGRTVRAAKRAHAILRCSEVVLARSGSYPASLATLAAALDLAPPSSARTPIWVRDPFATGRQPFGYSVVASSPREIIVTSAGADARLGTADDLTYRALDSATGRGHSRRSQRLLNSAYLNSPLLGHGTVAPATRAALAHQLGLRRRAEAARYGASPATAAAWALVRDAADLELERIRQVNGLTGTIPTQATGAGGMLAAVGRSDVLGFDAFGTEWLVGVGGFRSAGGDRVEGGDDDL